MPLLPESFETLFDTLFLSSEVKCLQEAYGQLLLGTAGLVHARRDALSPAVPFSTQLKSLYEELINWYNKIYHACEIRDPYSALLTAVSLELELTRAFSGTGVSTSELPDIVSEYDPNHPGRLDAAARRHQSALLDLLSRHGVVLQEFKGFEELKRYVDALGPESE